MLSVVPFEAEFRANVISLFVNYTQFRAPSVEQNAQIPKLHQMLRDGIQEPLL